VLAQRLKLLRQTEKASLLHPTLLRELLPAE
jgi:hypothetical protein